MPIAMHIAYAVLAFVLGSIIGSFLNVVILRTPLHQSIVKEPSHCFSCGHRLAWYDMFPIFSWIFLRGKCRYCGEKISPRYMIVEAVTAVLYCLAYLVFGFRLELAFSAVLFAVLVVLSAIDIDRFEIPYWCSITTAVLGVIAIFVFKETPWYERLIAMGVILVIFVILVLVGGMGGGDLQLMVGASLLLGYKVFVALFIGVLTGAVYGTVKKLRDRSDEKMISDKLKKLAEEWYQNQLDQNVGYVTEGHDDIIVGSISEGDPDIEWEFLDENVWRGLPDKAKLSRELRKNITDEREGGFKIFIRGDKIERVKYSRRMVFGPFLGFGIATCWLVGGHLINWYLSLMR